MEESLRDMLAVLLGDSAGYFGEELDRLSEPRRANIVRIAQAAIRRLGDRISEPGGVPPRLAGSLLADGSFCRDPLAAEYWGGVVASSRTPVPDDDRGVRRLKLLARLSTWQIRSHYLFYAALRRLLAASANPGAFDFDSKRYLMATFAPVYGYVRAMAFGDPELANMPALAADILVGLGQELLLDGSNTGTEEYLKKFFKTDAIRGEGIVFAPSVMGVQLFLWAFGEGDRPVGRFVDPGFDCSVAGVPDGIEGAALVYG